MKPGNILLPIDITACSPEAFTFVNRLVASAGMATVTLLNVVHLNVWVPENRLYIETAREAGESLLRLGEKFLDPRVVVRVCVRSGKPAEGILDEAGSSVADLIVMTSVERSSRPFRFLRAPILETVLKFAPCPVSVVRVRNRIDFTMHPRPAAVIPSMQPVLLPSSSWTALPCPAQR